MRTTREQLDQLQDVINRATDSPAEYFETVGDARRVNPRHFYIQGAYGGYRLERLCESGGSEDISPRLPAGELRVWILAYLDGIREGLEIGIRRMKKGGM